MTPTEAQRALGLLLIQCGALMPIGWVRENGTGSKLMEAVEMAMNALEAMKERDEQGKGNAQWKN